MYPLSDNSAIPQPIFRPYGCIDWHEGIELSATLQEVDSSGGPIGTAADGADDSGNAPTGGCSTTHVWQFRFDVQPEKTYNLKVTAKEGMKEQNISRKQLRTPRAFRAELAAGKPIAVPARSAAPAAPHLNVRVSIDAPPSPDEGDTVVPVSRRFLAYGRTTFSDCPLQVSTFAWVYRLSDKITIRPGDPLPKGEYDWKFRFELPEECEGVTLLLLVRATVKELDTDGFAYRLIRWDKNDDEDDEDYSQ